MMARAFTDQTFNAQPSAPAKAVVLLSTADKGKNKRMCRAFIDGLSTEADIRKFTSSAIIPTYWLLKPMEDRTPSSEPTTAELKDCDYLIANYRYDEATTLLKLYGFAGAKGPVLVAVNPANDLVTVDFTKANGKDTVKYLNAWFTTGSAVVTSKTALSTIGHVLCQAAKATFPEQPALKAGEKPTVLQEIAGVFHTVHNYLSGAIFVAASFNLVCPSAAPVPTTT